VTTLGVISDTHGLLRPEARRELAGVDRIIHAGDIDDRAALQWLSALGRLTVVRGNCDRGAWAASLRDEETLEVEGRRIWVVHDLGTISIDPRAAGVAVVVSGHSHIPKNETRDGVLHFNPGSAGPRRFGKPITMGRLVLTAGEIRGEIITLQE
jgi:putative phosphoesterase